MPEDAGAVFCRGRVIDHVSANRFLMDQVSAWSKLSADVEAFTSNLIRGAVSFLETHPYQFADERGKCVIDSTGWISVDSFYRFVASICATQGIGKAC
eukprot:5433621-Alexandrium_andersonii.AAC.1